MLCILGDAVRLNIVQYYTLLLHCLIVTELLHFLHFVDNCKKVLIDS